MDREISAPHLQHLRKSGQGGRVRLDAPFTISSRCFTVILGMAEPFLGGWGIGPGGHRGLSHGRLEM
jgi:hypothetical protein